MTTIPSVSLYPPFLYLSLSPSLLPLCIPPLDISVSDSLFMFFQLCPFPFFLFDPPFLLTLFPLFLLILPVTPTPPTHVSLLLTLVLFASSVYYLSVDYIPTHRPLSPVVIEV